MARSRFSEINPRYQVFLERLGVTEVEHFLALPAVIVSGHPNRNVAQVTLGPGPGEVRAYLKREHHIFWRDYVSSAWAGFGFVSRSCREARMLRALRQAGISCPDVIAAGQDGHGRAFLLVRELTGARELREVLQERLVSTGLAPWATRRALARKLGETLARIHDAGFSHGDLYATHVLVNLDNGAIHFLDWQRSRRWRRLGGRLQLRDLAALDATIAEGLAPPRERLLFLLAYQQALRHRASLSRTLATVVRRSERLQRKRYIRELRQAPLPIGVQNLIWLDGEALCVTREFQAVLPGKAPAWLLPTAPPAGRRNHLERERVLISKDRPAMLVRRWSDQPLRWLWSRIRGRPFTSPELQQAATLFRLQRYGIGTPRLLAVGQRHRLPWRTESFILTEPISARAHGLQSVGLAEWLALRSRQDLFSAERKQYRRILMEAGSVFRTVHDAGCYLGPHPSPLSRSCGSAVGDGVGGEGGPRLPLAVQCHSGGTAAVVLEDPAELRTQRRPSQARSLRDLAVLCRTLARSLASRTDILRFFLGYTGLKHLTPAGKQFLRQVLSTASAEC